MKHTTPKPPEEPTRAIKGFDAGMKCRGFQFEVGQTYRHEGPVEDCKSGFHSITGHPLAVFEYYPPAGARFCRVEISGATSSNDGTKTASEILTVGSEIGFSDLVQEAVEWVKSHATPDGESATGDHGAASATGDQGAASATGDQGAASATGYQGAASATGYRGAASATGYQGAASATGDQGAASATGDHGAASATGYRGAASATGYRGAASATGDQGAAMSCGVSGSVRGAAGNALFLVERGEDYEIVNVWAGIAGRDGIEPDTFYTLRDGQPVKLEA